MVSMLRTGTEWLRDKRVSHMSRTVVYRRVDNTVSVSATVANSSFEQTESNALVGHLEFRDFIIRTADLILASVNVLPEIGDLVDEVREGITYTYQVTAPGIESPWRYSDPYKNILRIHTKLLTTSADPPVPVDAWIDGSPGFGFIEFNRDLTTGVLNAANWILMWSGSAYVGQSADVAITGSPPRPNRTVVVDFADPSPTIPSPFYIGIEFAPPPSDVLSSFGVAAVAFERTVYRVV